MERIIDKVNVKRARLGKSKMTSGDAYRITLSYNGKKVWFVFNDNYLNNSSKKDLLECLMLDASAYENCKNLDDFIREFGYSQQRANGLKAYNGCKKQSDRLQKLFTLNEQQQLQEELEESWC